MTAAAPPAPADRIAGIIDGLCRMVAARGGGRDRLDGPLVILIWRHLRRLAAAIAALAGRIAAGRHRRYPARRRASPRPVTSRPAAPTPPQRLPHAPAWLLSLVPQAAAGASQLRYLLADPDMAALLDTAPQMRRLLRPLCRMLGVNLPPAAAPAAPLRPIAAGGAPPPAAPPERPPRKLETFTPRNARRQPVPA